MRSIRVSGVRRSLRRVLVGALAAGCGFVATPAAAQSTTFTLDRAQISGAPDDGFMVHRPYVGDSTRWFINGAVGFSLNPLRDNHVQTGYQQEGAAPISGQFPTYLTAGIQLAGVVGITAHIPFTPYQFTGVEPNSTQVGTVGITDRNAAMNDVRFDARVKAWESNDRKTRLGGFGAFTLPTGSQYGFGGDNQASALLALSAEHNFGPFFLATHIGPHFGPTGNLGGRTDLYVGSELRYAVGAFIPLRDERLRLGVEIWGSTGIQTLNDESTFFKGQNTTVEWLAQARFLVSKDKRTYLNAGGGTRLSDGYGSADVRVLFSLGRYFGFTDNDPKSPPPRVQVVDNASFHGDDRDGDGYPDDADACPDEKEDGKKPDPSDGCPAPPDADGDGIVDSKDKCPNDPEDFDKIQDKDGCPEEDADNDKVMDIVDKCPETPGPKNRNKKKNGCPTKIKIASDGSVQLLKPIEFATGKATIKPVSYVILKEVALVMKSRRDIKMLVEGHTDNRGSHGFNVKLSDSRAAAVRKYLIKAGIKGDRLESKGYGPDKPVDTNDTNEGRARNRRVQFVIQEDPASNGAAWE